jgi:hypothetical protein
MNREDIIKLAREVGYPLVEYEGTPYIPPLLVVLLETVAAAAQAVPDAFDGGVYLGDGKDHAIKHHVSYKPAQQEPDHSDELTIAYMSGVHRGKELAAQRQWTGLTEQQKQELAENWFAEDWAITKAIGMMYDHETKLKENT